MSGHVETATSGTAHFGEANLVVNRFSRYAALGGLLPLPVIDMAAIAAVQLKMLSQLSHLYGVPFSKNVAKELIGTILGVGVSYNLGSAGLLAIGPYARLVPIAGPLIGAAVVPAVAAAVTNVLGRIFIRHFESGGQLLDLDVTAAREAFKADFSRHSPKTAYGTEPAATEATVA